MSTSDRNLGYSADEYAALAGFDDDWRDTWWSQDYLELLARRLGFGDARRVLDVGCGAGHWGQRLGTLLPDGAQITGVDHEPAFLEGAWARAKGRPHHFEYREASAEALPFEDGAFDLVTCQTVLMHVADARAVVSEMARVTRPGGLVLATEPNNLAGALSNRQSTPGVGAAAIDRLFAFEHCVLRGKRAIGQGDATVGEHLPRYFAEAGLTNLRVSTNDTCALLVPPYDSAAERSTIALLRQWSDNEVCSWGTRPTVRRLYLAGGGIEAEFDELFELSLSTLRRMLDAIDAGDFYGAGGFLMYVVCGIARP